MWSTFTETLAQLYAQYEKIRAVQERKRGLLVALDMEGLEKLVAEEDFLARAVQQLEKQRLSQLAHIAQATPGVTAETNMEELALLAVNRQLGRIGGAVVDPVYGSGGGEQVRHLKKNLDYKA